jgi:hypothetical protein
MYLRKKLEEIRLHISIFVAVLMNTVVCAQCCSIKHNVKCLFDEIKHFK